MIKKFADELKEARLNKDITLQQISVKTKIDIKFLEAIESGNFEVLPDVYFRAFLKDYARAIGLDENSVIKRYDAARSGRQLDERVPGETGTSPRKHIPETHHEEESHAPVSVPKETYKSEIKTPAYASSDEEEGVVGNSSGRKLWVVIGGAAVVIIAALIYLFFFNTSSTEIITDNPLDESGYNGSERFETVDTTKAQSQQNTAPVADDSLDLRLTSGEETWVRIVPDNTNRPVEFTLQKNGERTIKAKRNFRVVLGNSGSVQLFLEGKPLTFEGTSGRSRSINIDSTGTITNVRTVQRRTTERTPEKATETQEKQPVNE